MQKEINYETEAKIVRYKTNSVQIINKSPVKGYDD